jgi:hypothetical protein
MAHVDRIWIHSGDKVTKEITAYIRLKPSGEVAVKFKMPEVFFDCILTAAQHAADLHEQQMKAEILAEKEQPK